MCVYIYCKYVWVEFIRTEFLDLFLMRLWCIQRVDNQYLILFISTFINLLKNIQEAHITIEVLTNHCRIV